MLTFPNAKINIGLQIIEKRSDGYHNLASCFYPVGWSDILEILPAPTLSFKSTGIIIPGNAEGNLCLKAYQLLKSDFDIPPVQMHLHKVVPIGAGLGGGSADAAFTLKSLNSIFELALSNTALENYARKLGADCAFFIENKPQFCYEKGDVFENIDLTLRGKYLVLINPNIHISTAEAYGGVVPQTPQTNLQELLKKDLTTWKNTVFNNFEQHLLPKYPIIAHIKKQLYETGAIYASMTGSGSTVFGIFQEKPKSLISFEGFLTWEGLLG